jgi:hypothetical protein
MSDLRNPLQEIEHRLIGLERKCNGLRLIIIGLIALFGASLFVGAGRPNAVVAAKAFLLKGDKGETVGEFRYNEWSGAPELIFHDKSKPIKRKQVSLTGGEIPSLRFYDDNGIIGQTVLSTHGLEIREAGGKAIIELIVIPDLEEAASIRIATYDVKDKEDRENKDGGRKSDAAPERTLTIKNSMELKGEGLSLLDGKGGHVNVGFDAITRLPAVSVSDRKSGSITMGVGRGITPDDDGHAALNVRGPQKDDPLRASSISLSTYGDNAIFSVNARPTHKGRSEQSTVALLANQESSAVFLSDHEGVGRAQLFVNKDRLPSISVQDETGQDRAILGSVGLVNRKTDVRTNKPESSITLFGRDGDIVHSIP